MAESDLLIIEHLSKRYDLGAAAAAPTAPGSSETNRQAARSLWALKDINLTVPRGIVLGVIGRNGAGKTTLLRVLSRITLPTEGRVVGHGRVFPMLEVGASFHPDFTGRENIYLNAAMFGVSRDYVDVHMDEIIAFAGVGERIDDSVRHMSGGTYIRLAFSVAVNLRPDLLLADEVLAVGDPAFQRQGLDRIRAEQKRGMTVVFVSHDMRAVAHICDEVVWLDHGQIRQIGAPDEIIGAYEREILSGSHLQVGGTMTSTDAARIVLVRLLGETGDEVAETTQSAPFKIELVFEARTAGLEATPGVDIFLGKTLIASLWSDEPLAVPETGLHSAVVTVPGQLFSARVYTIKATLQMTDPRDGKSTVYTAPETLDLPVRGIDVVDSDGKTLKRQTAGLVAPHLQWCMTAGAPPTQWIDDSSEHP